VTNKSNHPNIISDDGKDLKERSRDVAAGLAERANEVGARTMAAVGSSLQEVAGKLEDLDHPGGVRGKVAESLTGAGRYLEDVDPKSALINLDSAIQAHPYRALAVGLGVGWLIGRIARR
jgi:hypothetical protein